MNKYIRIILGILTTILLLLLLSPFISLLLPQKFANRTYYRLLYHVIVDKETADCRSKEEKLSRLLQYVVDHEFAQGIPYEYKPAQSLIYGEAFCDYQACTLNALLGLAGIPTRYAMLLDKDRISPHTLNEVFLDNKWCVVDPLMNIIFTDQSGNKVSLEQMSDAPNLIYNNRKLTALKEYDKVAYDGFVQWFSRMFPIPVAPKRSKPYIFQSHIFDYIADFYFKVFKYKFFNLYQNIYLKLRNVRSTQEDARLFFAARNYHLSYRRDLAKRSYDMLLKEYPKSNYVQDTIFFNAILYFEMKDFSKSLGLFNLIIDKYPQKWGNAAYYYLGKIYDLIGDKEASLTSYTKAGTLKLSAQTIEELNKRCLQR